MEEKAMGNPAVSEVSDASQGTVASNASNPQDRGRKPTIQPKQKKQATDETKFHPVTGRVTNPFDILLSDIKLFAAPKGRQFAIIKKNETKQIFEIGSSDLNEALELAYYELQEDLPDPKQLRKFVKKLALRAKHYSPVIDVYQRFAYVDGKIYIDLCDSQSRVVCGLA